LLLLEQSEEDSEQAVTGTVKASRQFEAG
jgi:hypothetical protein